MMPLLLRTTICVAFAVWLSRKVGQWRQLKLGSYFVAVIVGATVLGCFPPLQVKANWTRATTHGKPNGLEEYLINKVWFGFYPRYAWPGANYSLNSHYTAARYRPSGESEPFVMNNVELSLDYPYLLVELSFLCGYVVWKSMRRSA